MGIIRIDPIRGFDSLSRKMNTIINEFDKGLNLEYGPFSPKVDIEDNEEKIHISAELPGVKKENVKITITEDNYLVIKGSKFKEEKIANEKTDESTAEQNPELANERVYLKMERSYGEFTRSFQLPLNINKDSISAKYENGVLHIMLDKILPAKAKEVEISIS